MTLTVLDGLFRAEQMTRSISLYSLPDQVTRGDLEEIIN